MKPTGLQQLFEEHREQLLRYLRAHGAGDSAEDCLQELWFKIADSPAGPIASPRNYLFRAATNLMIDRRRSDIQGRRRDHDWSTLADRIEGSVANDPGPDRAIDARQLLEIVNRELESLTPRARTIFREHRVEGRTQREIAANMGISQSTVESDLRLAYRLLAEIRERLDEE